MSQTRHIDQDARMVWLSLRRLRTPRTVREMTWLWSPSFTAVKMEAILRRLTAAGHATYAAHQLRHAWEVTDENTPLPGYEPGADRRQCGRAGAAA